MTRHTAPEHETLDLISWLGHVTGFDHSILLGSVVVVGIVLTAAVAGWLAERF